jgi:hypothetical protein
MIQTIALPILICYLHWQCMSRLGSEENCALAIAFGFGSHPADVGEFWGECRTTRLHCGGLSIAYNELFRQVGEVLIKSVSSLYGYPLSVAVGMVGMLSWLPCSWRLYTADAIQHCSQ